MELYEVVDEQDTKVLLSLESLFEALESVWVEHFEHQDRKL